MSVRFVNSMTMNCRTIFLLAISFSLVTHVTMAEDSWEYSPYRVQVWLAARTSACLTEEMQLEVLKQISSLAPRYAGYAWEVTTQNTPAPFATTQLAVLNQLSADQVVAAQDDVLSLDKVILLNLGCHDGDYTIDCREFDSRTQSLGPVYRQKTYQVGRIGADCAAAMARVFSPLVRVEHSLGRSAAVRVRAGGLVHGDDSIANVSDGEVLRPVIRRSNRQGELVSGGLQELPFTYLLVREREDYLLKCEVLSAARNPLAGRTSPRIEKIALAVRPWGDATQLQLLAKEDPSQTLEGYEVLVKIPLADEEEARQTVQTLGLTDWNGVIDLPVGQHPVLQIYVKNGDHLLARLPIVPGYQSLLSVELPSDDRRLEAEVFVKGMETTVMDLVARREILAARIQRRIEQGKIAEARQLLDELKSFRTRDDLDAMLTSRQQAGLSSKNEREQQRIDQLLSGTRILLNKHLAPETLVALQRLVEKAEQAAGAEKGE